MSSGPRGARPLAAAGQRRVALAATSRGSSLNGGGNASGVSSSASSSSTSGNGSSSLGAPVRASPQRAAATALAGALLSAAAALGGPGAVPPAVAGQNPLLDVPSCSDFKASSSGVKFCEAKVGRGESPLSGDLIMVDYTARALAAGGKVFDGSQKFKFFVGQGEPQVLPGFDLAVLGDGDALTPIREGGVRTVVLPPALAYGEKGDGCLYGLDGSCRIPPNSEVELTFRYLGLGYGK